MPCGVGWAFETVGENVMSDAVKVKGEQRAEAQTDPEFKKLFDEQTPEQKAWGRLIGKIILARSNAQVEEAFDWWAVEHNGGMGLKTQDKVVALFHAIGSLGCDESQYRVLRQMYIKANCK